MLTWDGGGLYEKHSSKHRLHSISRAQDQDGSEWFCHAIRHLLQSHQGIRLSSETPWEEFLPRAILRPAACQEWTLLPVSARTSVVKTIIAVIFSPSVYRKQTLPSCPLLAAENRQTKQMSRDVRAVPGAACSFPGEGASCRGLWGWWAWGWLWGRTSAPAHPPFSVYSVRRGSKYDQGNLKTVFLNSCSRPFADSVTYINWLQNFSWESRALRHGCWLWLLVLLAPLMCPLGFHFTS